MRSSRETNLMLPWPAALFVALILLSFTIPVLTFAFGIGALLVTRLVGDLYHMSWRNLPATLVSCAVMGGFAYLFGSGAYRVGSSVIDGLILRFWT